MITKDICNHLIEGEHNTMSIEEQIKYKKRFVKKLTKHFPELGIGDRQVKDINIVENVEEIELKPNPFIPSDCIERQFIPGNSKITIEIELARRS
jgi:hypothetical protein